MIDDLTLALRYLESGEPLPPDLATWLAPRLRQVAWGEPVGQVFGDPAARRRADRNRLLKAAADQIEGSCWRRAEWLSEQVSRLRQGRRCSELVRQADRINPVPETSRQLFEILSG